ncbi:histone-like nucleoid-structuring protein, MvaT/MvaU family [Pseudomonas sp.]|uniref:histone-like nucleoid-structuring protein, MvaT/MvaU family n=1 Tax=Pseudomonas sp. TaxID=306 RepID=UPI0028B22DD1|nr:histone-like nucleoid-structuring protein, MvaT/MvaU family [Pseudomonas sp.]
MSRLAEFRAAEKALQDQIAQLESMKKDAGLKREIEFEQKLLVLMKDYNKGLREIVAILDPKSPNKAPAPASKQHRRPRATKVYENPHNGELIETKGGNHRGLKAWKEEYGSETVETWLRA